jgi:sterol desaturase/sphingolipid hydroxylase (fatty acid hydroxylase superfamily)
MPAFWPFTATYFWAYMAGYWVPAFWFYLQDMRVFRLFKRIDDIAPEELHKTYMKTIPQILRNQLFLNLPALYYVSSTILITPFDWRRDFLHFVINNIVNVILFSLIHHALHHPSIYKYWHKKHHEHKLTISITSEYNHPVEEFLTWPVAAWAPLLIWPLSHRVMLFYVVTQASYGVVGHAGYLIPGLEEDIIRHHIHHEFFNYNYSGFKMYDVLMGTNRMAGTETEKKT